MTQPKKQLRNRAAKTPSGFQCPFCGSYTRKADEYYSSLTTILINRFINLLNSNNEKNYFNGVMDCIFNVFGITNSAIKKALKVAGYLEEYERRFGDDQSEGKTKCYVCGEFEDDWDMIIDDSLVAKRICEDCFSKKQKENKNQKLRNQLDA